MSTTEIFSLKWNDFETNVSKSFVNLRTETQLFDVTLVGQDQKKVSAHRLVLSACSDFFKNIFYSNSHSHPLLYLDGVDSEDINQMLDYMYKGEVKIKQDYLERFLQISNKFQLEGLLGGENNDDLNQAENDQDGDDNKNEIYLHETNLSTNQNYSQKLVKPVRKIRTERSLKVCDETLNATNYEVEGKFEELIVKEGNLFRCTMCDRTMTHKGSMKRHLETHLTGLNYNCKLCDQTFRSSMSLSNHKRWHN